MSDAIRLYPAGSVALEDLEPGLDFRRPEYRRAVFTAFYLFHLKHRAHPGAVYYLFPYLRAAYGWGPEEALWFAFLNGNTQHPLTSLILHRRFPTPATAHAMLPWFAEHYSDLTFDTDRRYHRKAFASAVLGYVDLVGGSQEAFWSDVVEEGGWPSVWEAARAIPTFGRLSAFSYAEYLRIMGVPFDCGNLLLEDMSGSKSHRNGLAIVTGRDDWDWHSSNPSGFTGDYPPGSINMLRLAAASLLDEARKRSFGQPWERDVSYFTLESTLCTYKGWHRVNRRYPNVYNDMLHDRIRASETRWPGEDFGVFWRARRDCLPAYLRLEDNPTDPGLTPVKQNHYRLTGEPIMMDQEYGWARNAFNDGVRAGAYGVRAARR